MLYGSRRVTRQQLIKRDIYITRQVLNLIDDPCLTFSLLQIWGGGEGLVLIWYNIPVNMMLLNWTHSEGIISGGWREYVGPPPLQSSSLTAPASIGPCIIDKAGSELTQLLLSSLLEVYCGGFVSLIVRSSDWQKSILMKVSHPNCSEQQLNSLCCIKYIPTIWI